MSERQAFLLISLLAVLGFGWGIYQVLKPPSLTISEKTVENRPIPDPRKVLPPKPSLENTTQSDTAPVFDNAQGLCQAFPTWNWTPDARYSYDYQNSFELALDMTPLMQGEELHGETYQVQMQIEGILNWRILTYEATPHPAAFALLQLSSVQVETNAKIMADLEALYSHLVMVKMNSQGTFLEFFFPPDLTNREMQMLSSLYSTIQWTIAEPKESKGRHIWTAEETDGLGVFPAHYHLALSNCREMVKTKLDYHQLQSFSGSTFENTIQGKVIASQWNAQLQANGQGLKQLKGKDELQLINNGEVWGQAALEQSLSVRDHLSSAGLAIWQEVEMDSFAQKWIALTDAKKRPRSKKVPENQQAILRERYKATTVDEILDKIKTASRLETLSDINRWQLKLRDYLIAFPEVAAQIPPVLKGIGRDQSLSGKYIHALKLAGHPQAQVALTQIMTDQAIFGNFRIQAISASEGLYPPENEVVQTLWDLVDAGKNQPEAELATVLGHNALINLGNVANNYPQGKQSAHYQEIAGKIVQELQGASRDVEINVALKALDNVGSPDHLDLISPFLTNPDVEIRKSATRVLRHYVKSAQAGQFLTEQAADESHRVRELSIGLLHARGDEKAVSTLQQRLSEEPKEHLRAQIAQSLASYKDQYPTVMDSLKEQIKVENNRVALVELYRAVYETAP